MSGAIGQGFILRAAAVRVRFEAGALAAVGEELGLLGCSRALILSTDKQQDAAEQLLASLGGLAVGIFAQAAMHTPVAVTEQAMRVAAELKADCTVALGGGSTTGLGKAIAYRADLPQVVIPTTYAGSEATAILGQTEDGVKTTITDAKVQPETIVYDPELLTSLPVELTVASALNAMAHAAEALYARDRNPVSSLLALEGMRAFRESLPQVIAAPSDVAARGKSLYGAWLCGMVLGQVGMALHHKLCHTLGGSFDLPHAQTHAIVLPHALAFNAQAVPQLLAPVAELFGGESPGRAVHGFARSIGAPLALRDLGLAEADLDRAAELAVSKPYWNPEPVTEPGVRKLLQAAWSGDAPA